MKLYSKKGARNSNKGRRRPQASIIILVCVNVVLFTAVAIVLISAIISSKRNSQEPDSSMEKSGVEAFSPAPRNVSEPPATIEDPEAQQEGTSSQLQETPVSPVEGTGDSSVDTGQEPQSGDAAGDTTGDTITETQDPPETPPSMSTEQFFLDDSGLFTGADTVSYLVYCFETGDFSTRGGSARVPSASVIKVFIMEYAFVKSDQGLLSLSETLGGSTILSLVTVMIRQSDNDATNALIRRFGMEELNAFFIEQGYSDTVLERYMLDYDRRMAGFDNYTSLSDCVAFLEKLYFNREEGLYRQMLEIMQGQQVRTKIPLKLPSGVIVANKTGELDDVENDIGIVFADNASFLIVVLASEVRSTAVMRNAIANFALAAYEWVTASSNRLE